MQNCEERSKELVLLLEQLDPVFLDSRYQSRDFSNNVPANVADGCPFKPELVYTGPLLDFNFVKADIMTMRLVLAYRKSLILKEPLPEHHAELANEVCSIFEALDRSPFIPGEALTKAQGLPAVACLFLREPVHVAWFRRKFASIENRG